MVNARIDDRHEVERLHDIGTVLAGDGVVRGEFEVTLECAHLVKHSGVNLGWVTAHLQHGEDERTELVTHGDAGELHGNVCPGAPDLEGRPTLVDAVESCADHRRERGDFFEEGAHLGGVRRFVDRCHELHGDRQHREVLGKLSGGGVVKHQDSFIALVAVATGGTRAVVWGPGSPTPTSDERKRQILPTRSIEGARVFSPSSHLAGQTSPG